MRERRVRTINNIAPAQEAQQGPLTSMERSQLFLVYTELRYPVTEYDPKAFVNGTQNDCNLLVDRGLLALAPLPVGRRVRNTLAYVFTPLGRGIARSMFARLGH